MSDHTDEAKAENGGKAPEVPIAQPPADKRLWQHGPGAGRAAKICTAFVTNGTPVPGIELTEQPCGSCGWTLGEHLANASSAAEPEVERRDPFTAIADALTLIASRVTFFREEDERNVRAAIADVRFAIDELNADENK